MKLNRRLFLQASAAVGAAFMTPIHAVARFIETPIKQQGHYMVMAFNAKLEDHSVFTDIDWKTCWDSIRENGVLDVPSQLWYVKVVAFRSFLVDRETHEISEAKWIPAGGLRPRTHATYVAHYKDGELMQVQKDRRGDYVHSMSPRKLHTNEYKMLFPSVPAFGREAELVVI